VVSQQQCRKNQKGFVEFLVTIRYHMKFYRCGWGELNKLNEIKVKGGKNTTVFEEALRKNR
jgi:hypothetical protein